MARLRSLSFPRVPLWEQHDEDVLSAQSPDQSPVIHSRDSSAASTVSTPVTPTFSTRSHNHWPSSASSIASIPDSPVNVTKSQLGDLVEHPEERDELPAFSALEEAVCICDAPFCNHQRNNLPESTAWGTASIPEWIPGDDSVIQEQRVPVRHKSNEISVDALALRMSRRWPSISKRWRDIQATTSISSPSIHSAPPSRSSSLRIPKVKRSLVNALDVLPPSPPMHAVDFETDEGWAHGARSPPLPVEISRPMSNDPVDRNELSRTPLLPPVMHENRNYSNEDVWIRSPLQSPSVASPSSNSNPVSAIHSPISSPIPGLDTPPLSAKPSTASFRHAASMNSMAVLPEFAPLSTSPETDPWALKLGHANFSIAPEPYLPRVCTKETCKELVDDWEAARMDYMRHAARVSEDYGPTSHIYKLTEQKWSEIDAIWRANYKVANLSAGESGEDLVFQPLAETAPLQKIPTLNDPVQPGKFPMVERKDIVGPMVQYAKLQQMPAKKSALLKLFTDPASLLGKTTKR